MQKCDRWFPGDEVKGNLRVMGKEAVPDRSLIGDSDTKRHMNHTSRLPARVWAFNENQLPGSAFNYPEQSSVSC